MSSSFNPQQYLTKLSGKDYLEVKWRLLWLRSVDPDAIVETQLVTDQSVVLRDRSGNEHPTREAVFHARVVLTSGGSATGYGSETSSDFNDYREKAETKAIGRALGALGYGTQFTAGEFDGEASAGRPVDAPTHAQGQQGAARVVGTSRYPNPPSQPVATPQNAQQGYVQSQGQAQTIQNPDAPASDKQRKWVEDLLAKKSVDPSLFIIEGRITKGEASNFISGINGPAENWPAATGAQIDEIGALLIRNGHNDEDFIFDDLNALQASVFINSLRSGRLPELLEQQAGMATQ